MSSSPQRFLFGGDWNPEQWSRDTWEHDIDLLEQAHINEATINVFSWGLVQPDEHTYDFAMLDEIIDLLVQHDFSIVLATGTAAIPAWMARDYPQVMRTDINGTHHVFGGRHNFCPSSPIYRQFSKALASHTAQRYAHVSNIVTWHVNNEYGNGGGYCYCALCTQEFRAWLKRKYKSIDMLNQAWCTNFWSHTLHDFDEIVPPVTYGDGITENKCVISGLLIDYRRFQNEQMLACYCTERDAIREYDQQTPITTNLMGAFADLDYFTWGKQMDVVSWDNYPSMDTEPSFTAMCHDLMRGVGNGKPFMLMEQTPNQQNWFPYCSVKQPGEVSALSWQAIAHGADTVQFFQLKQSVGGCERFHGAVIGHDNSSHSRTFQSVQALGADLEDHARSVLGSTVHARVAVVFDWENYWSLAGCVGPTQGLHYPNEVHRYYRAFWRRNIDVDIIESTADLAILKQYDIVCAPAAIMMKPGVAETWRAYVEQGGRLITGYMSGIHNEYDLVIEGGYPGPLRDLCGVWVEEMDALAPDQIVPVHIQASPMYSELQGAGSIIANIMKLEGAQSLAVYGGDSFYSGTPAVSQHHVKQGYAYYIGTALDDLSMSAIIDSIIADVGIATIDTPPGIEIRHRYQQDGTPITFIINMNNKEVPHCPIVGTLNPFEVRVFISERELNTPKEPRS